MGNTAFKAKPAATGARLKSRSANGLGAEKRNAWRLAALLVKAKALAKEGADDPANAAADWWEVLTDEDRADLRKCPHVIAEHAKITGKELPSI